MITFYDFDASPNCLKIKILLKELDIPFQERRMTRPELRAQPYGAQFPTAQAPAIVDGEIALAESGAIALYLAQKHGRFIPESAPRRALMYQALFVEASLLAPPSEDRACSASCTSPRASAIFCASKSFLPRPFVWARSWAICWATDPTSPKSSASRTFSSMPRRASRSPTEFSATHRRTWSIGARE
jgi:hypothetical protein